MISPVDLLNTWLLEEQNAGPLNPRQAVLSTATRGAVPPHVVDICEIDEHGLLFLLSVKGGRLMS